MTPLPTLDRTLVAAHSSGSGSVDFPDPSMLDLPETAVQFGTGAFLRGFVDYFIDAANRAGAFGGRIVAVGSTGSGRDRALREQDGLYTLAVRGVEGGQTCATQRVIGSVSRALSATDEWDAVLECARNPALELIFSNTTEVGIALDEGDLPTLVPPRSFPGKLTRFLEERARTFDYDPARGVAVIPCELIDGNGSRLREIVLALAARWQFDPRFAGWITIAVPFCNTLVDRIVPGAPPAEQADELRALLGYEDGLTTICEPYRLFAIEPRGATPRQLRFASADPGIAIVDDAGPYRERKVRLLNGAHTASVSVALLAGCETVREMLDDELLGRFLRRALLDEIVPGVEAPGAGEFAHAVLDRFANPFIRHALFDITLQGTTKMRVRVVPSIVAYATRTGEPPPSLAFGLAAFLLFQRGELQTARMARGLPVPADDHAARLRALWDAPRAEPGAVARQALGDAELWGRDLREIPGLADLVAEQLGRMRDAGVRAALESLLAERVT